MALVCVMSVVSRLNLYVSDKIANLGANVFVVDRIGIITNLDEITKAQKRPSLTVDDFNALKGSLRLSSSVAAEDSTTLDVPVLGSIS
jgi:hypothetical protein